MFMREWIGKCRRQVAGVVDICQDGVVRSKKNLASVAAKSISPTTAKCK
jgi:hypothetical protein